MTERKRVTVTPKTRLRIFQRDNYKCTNCGASPATDPEVRLEIDHHKPFSLGGQDGDDNYRTLCQRCNRGKGNDESLNKGADSDLLNVLDRINPEIIRTMATNGTAVVVANSEEFSEVQRRARYVDGYEIEIIPNTISGYRAGFNLGIYTLNDNAASKTHFRITPKA